MMMLDKSRKCQKKLEQSEVYAFLLVSGMSEKERVS